MPVSRQLNRRDFLKTGAAAAGAFAVPVILPARFMGAEGEPPSERVRIAHVGVRNQGMSNLKALAKNTVAVCDVDRNVLAKAKAEAEKATGQPCEAYTDYRKLLEREDIDAIVVTTPDHWHARITIDACEAGKDVYCEKPLSLTIAEGQAMVRAARRYGRIVQTGSQQRSDAKFRQACELVRNRKLGKVHTIRVGIPGVNFTGPAVPDSAPPAELDYDFWLGPAPQRPYNVNRVHYNFRFFWDYSGGQLTNFGAHHLDIVQWALDMDESGPLSAEATAKYHPESWYEVPSWFHITYKYPGDVTVLCGQDYKGGVTFEGEKGTLSVTRGKLEASAPELLTESAGGVRLYESANHHRDWLECVKTRKPPVCDVEIGHRSATVCHLGNIAVRSGRPVRWDAERERVLGDREQARMVAYPYRAPWKL